MEKFSVKMLKGQSVKYASSEEIVSILKDAGWSEAEKAKEPKKAADKKPKKSEKEE